MLHRFIILKNFDLAMRDHNSRIVMRERRREKPAYWCPISFLRSQSVAFKRWRSVEERAPGEPGQEEDRETAKGRSGGQEEEVGAMYRGHSSDPLTSAATLVATCSPV